MKIIIIVAIDVLLASVPVATYQNIVLIMMEQFTRIVAQWYCLAKAVFMRDQNHRSSSYAEDRHVASHHFGAGIEIR